MTTHFKQLLFASSVVGVFVGITLALSGPGVQAQTTTVDAGCECTISGSASYDCSSPSSCGAGQYECDVNCVE